MRKYISLAISFVIIWIVSAVAFYLIGGKVFDSSFFQQWSNDVEIGLSCSLAGLFGPIIAAYIEKKFKKGT